MYPKPSAPPLLDILDDDLLVDYNCERGCDVEFLVGPSPDQVIRIPVHSCKLQEYPVFKAMLSENFISGLESSATHDENTPPWRKMRQIPVIDVDGKAFDNLMKFVYRKPLNLQMQTLEMVIETLKAAHKYILPQLFRECVKQLSKLISLTNAIWVYATLHFLCNDVDNLEELIKSESQKSMPKRRRNSGSDGSHSPQHSLGQNDLSAGLEIKDACVWLLGQTLAFIDVHAFHVIQSDELERLELPSLEFLLKRDSLDVSESTVFSALVRWAENQCKQKHLTLTPESKRLVLHDLIYLVRYFQMTDVEFRSGPEDSGLLSPLESAVIRNMICFGKPDFTPDNLAAVAPELYNLRIHWDQLKQARTPCQNRRKSVSITGLGKLTKKRKWSSLREKGEKRKTSVKLKKVGGLVKNYCLPCTTDNPKELRRGSDFSFTHGGTQLKTETVTGGSVKRRESTLDKFVYISVNIFAFFFD